MKIKTRKLFVHRLLYLILALFLSLEVNARQYHVSVYGKDTNDGSLQHPFRTINHAAQLAKPGDTVTVHAGIYREWVQPASGGSSERRRIVYEAAPGEKVEIKGSEQIRNWLSLGGGIWKTSLPDRFFGDYNPYLDLVAGDWYFGNMKLGSLLQGDWYYHKGLHTGEVYLDGKALHEAADLDEVKSGKNIGNPVGVDPSSVLDGSYTWYAVHQHDSTIIYANFHDADPDRSVTEINVRPTCFYPLKTGINYITVRGFGVSQAATQWAAPTAEQVGAIGTNYSKGWIIEDNEVSESKCVGITLGKDRASGQNSWSRDMSQDGSVVYTNMIKREIASGWNKANVGSHIVRNNTIFNCGAAGICGSFGAIFSRIIGNTIYDIYTNRRYWGAEMAGIKIHGAIDVLIKGNCIHNTYQGIWLDWMAQGTRVSSNLCYQNDYVDFFAEVDHGPYLVDNNIFLSGFSLKDWSEGGAFVYNLFAGMISRAPQDRKTPWFQQHSTIWAGLDSIRGGDDRFYNNIFVGTGGSEKFQRSMYMAKDAIDDYSGYGLGIYDDAAQPVNAGGNLYLSGAEPCREEKDPACFPKTIVHVQLFKKSGQLFLHLKLEGLSLITHGPIVTTELLGKTLVSAALYENPDGSPITINTDYFGHLRAKNITEAGPFNFRKVPAKEVVVWPVKESERKQ